MPQGANPSTAYGWQDSRNPGSLDYILPCLVRLLEDIKARKVLDLGCGNGATTAAMREHGFDVVGCEPDDEGVAIARARGGAFHQLGVYDDPGELVREAFDAVVCTEVIEHLYLPRHLFGFAGKVLAPGGHLVVSTPYHGYLKNLVLSLTGKWDSHFMALHDGGHIKFWSRATLEALFREQGFEVTGFCGVGRSPGLWKSMLVMGRKP